MNNTDRDVSSEIDVFMDYIDGPIHAGDTIMLL
jgi:hypothetical protein